MPQRKDLKWSQLRVGLMVSVSLIVLAVGIFFISGSVGFLTTKYTLRVYFSTAGGLREGAQVRVAGIPAGNVDRIRLSNSADPDRAVEVDLKIAKRFQPDIRADSEADQTTAGLLGDTYIDISRGTPNQPAIPPGGVVKSHQEKDIKQIVQNADDVISNLRVLSSKLNDIANQVTSGQGTIGKMIYDPSFYNTMNGTVEKANRIVTEVGEGKGTVGKFLVDETVYNQTVATLDKVNHLVDEAENGNGTLAKLLKDPTLYDTMSRTVQRADVLMDNINQGRGTLGKLAKDPELYNRMNDTLGHVDSITARMDRGDGSLGLLSTSSKLYDNLSASAASLREFLTEFRKNPKRYLTLRVRIF